MAVIACAAGQEYDWAEVVHSVHMVEYSHFFIFRIFFLTQMKQFIARSKIQHKAQKKYSHSLSCTVCTSAVSVHESSGFILIFEVQARSLYT